MSRVAGRIYGIHTGMLLKRYREKLIHSNKIKEMENVLKRFRVNKIHIYTVRIRLLLFVTTASSCEVTHLLHLQVLRLLRNSEIVNSSSGKVLLHP